MISELRWFRQAPVRQAGGGVINLRRDCDLNGRRQIKTASIYRWTNPWHGLLSPSCVALLWYEITNLPVHHPPPPSPCKSSRKRSRKQKPKPKTPLAISPRPCRSDVTPPCPPKCQKTSPSKTASKTANQTPQNPHHHLPIIQQRPPLAHRTQQLGLKNKLALLCYETPSLPV